MSEDRALGKTGRREKPREGLAIFSRLLRFLHLDFQVHLRSLMSSDKKTPNQTNGIPSLESDISRLTSLLASTSQTSTTNGNETDNPETVDRGEIDELGTEEVEELIRRMEAANDIADGVENKLDGILEHLDGLLSSLGAEGEVKENNSPTDSQPGR